MNDIEHFNKLGVLDILLSDMSTKKNIVWATSSYASNGYGYEPENQIESKLITGNHLGIIKTRAEKATEEQVSLTRSFAEVFTPTWICKLMIDEAYVQGGWATLEDIKAKRDYIRSTCLEITCGEAPFIVNRYDASDGSFVPVPERIGVLDRKLKVVKDITESRDAWKKWATIALKSVYGYEYQGDNLLIARLNVLKSIEEAIEDAGWIPLKKVELKNFARIIAKNFWQMDGLNYCVPYKALDEVSDQLTLWDMLDFNSDNPTIEPRENVLAQTYDWAINRIIDFRDIVKGWNKMKFDFVIGNPPYQESGTTNNKAEAIYPYFYDSVADVTDRYMLITPARFLFNAGLTPKKWNQKMLSDTHLKIEKYFQDSSEVFPNTNINGGVVITYHDVTQEYEPIGMFIPDETFRKIANRFNHLGTESMSSIIYGGRSDLKFNDVFLNDYPETPDRILKLLQSKHKEIKKLGPNEEYELKSSSFERTPYAFENVEPESIKDYYKILGVEKGKRVYKWVLKKYLSPRYPDNNNIGSFKVLLSNADGAAGQIGKPVPARIIGKPIIAEPFTSSFPTFMSIGKFDTKDEAQAVEKYIKTKFVRVLLGVLKVTQHITPATWKYVPLQDFTSASDLDWSKSIPEIDQQLYKKYDLSPEEIEFIETHVKEMD